MVSLAVLEQELADARQELRNLIVMGMNPRFAKDAWVIREAERSCRAEVKLRIKALAYGKSQGAV